FLFFFSSRRRHTRFSRDWSSDVCSSDLEDFFFISINICNVGYNMVFITHPTFYAYRLLISKRLPSKKGRIHIYELYLAIISRDRSEERRVGKDCKSRWDTWQAEKRKCMH